MAVKIRLSRAGKKKVPFHTIVVADSRKKRDGAVIESIGTVDALHGALVTFNEASYLGWIEKGAQPTDSAKKIYRLFKQTTHSAQGTETAPAKTKKTVKKKATASAATEENK